MEERIEFQIVDAATSPPRLCSVLPSLPLPFFVYFPYFLFLPSFVLGLLLLFLPIYLIFYPFLPLPPLSFPFIILHSPSTPFAPFLFSSSIFPNCPPHFILAKCSSLFWHWHCPEAHVRRERMSWGKYSGGDEGELL